MRQYGEEDVMVRAIHEAGHAVVGHVIGRIIDEVSVVPKSVEG